LAESLYIGCQHYTKEASHLSSGKWDVFLYVLGGSQWNICRLLNRIRGWPEMSAEFWDSFGAYLRVQYDPHEPCFFAMLFGGFTGENTDVQTV